MQYVVIIEPADYGSFSVWVPDLPGCVSCRDTPEEALRNIREAVLGHVGALKEFGEPVPPPRSVARVVKAA